MKLKRILPLVLGLVLVVPQGFADGIQQALDNQNKPRHQVDTYKVKKATNKVTRGASAAFRQTQYFAEDTMEAATREDNIFSRFGRTLKATFLGTDSSNTRVMLFPKHFKGKSVEQVYTELLNEYGYDKNLILSYCSKPSSKEGKCNETFPKTQKLSKMTGYKELSPKEQSEVRAFHFEQNKDFLVKIENLAYSENSRKKAKEVKQASRDLKEAKIVVDYANADIEDVNKRIGELEGLIDDNLNNSQSLANQYSDEIKYLEANPPENLTKIEIQQRTRRLNVLHEKAKNNNLKLANNKKDLESYKQELLSLQKRKDINKEKVEKAINKVEKSQKELQVLLKDESKNAQKLASLLDQIKPDYQLKSDLQIAKNTFDKQQEKTDTKLDLLLMKADLVAQNLELNEVQAKAMSDLIDEQLGESSVGLYVNSQIAKLGEALCRKRNLCEATDLDLFKDIQDILGAPIKQCAGH